MSVGRTVAGVVAVVAIAGGVVVAATAPNQTLALHAAVPSVRPSPSPTALPPAEQFLAWGPSQAQWDEALATAAALPLERAAGQVIVASVDSPRASGARKVVAEHHLGGVIVMGGAVDSTSQVRELTGAVQDGGGERDWPVIVSVDHEGGPVARLAPLLPGLPAFMAAGSSKDKSVVRDTYARTGADMAGLGFNLNYAPVADVTIGMGDPVIRTRAAGSDPENVARTVEAAVEGFVAGGVAPTVKHFPGHGSVTSDSHVVLPRQRATVQELEQRDLIPFERAVRAGAPAVMMSHIAVEEWGGVPATLAPEAYAYLREEWEFTGVIVTDALNMRAVSDDYSSGEAAVAAIGAGADIVLMPANVGRAHAGLVSAVEDGTLPRERLDEAAARSILLMRWQESLTPETQADEGNYAQGLVAAGATVVAPLCGTALVGDRVVLRGGWAGERDAVAARLADHGIEVGSRGTVVELVGAPDRAATADVVVALDGPWGLEDSSADAYVGLYGRSADALAGLADILAGQASPQAQWPVPVNGLPYGPCPSPR